MFLENIQPLTQAMEVARAQHKQSALNVARFNSSKADSVTQVDFSQVLKLSFLDPDVSLNKIIQDNSKSVSKDNVSLDQLTADALDASGRYRALVEVVNRKMGLMSIAVAGRER